MNKQLPKITKKRIQKRLKLSAAIFLMIVIAVLVLSGTALAAINNKYKNKIYPGVFINSINMGGKTPEQATAILESYANQLSDIGVDFTFENYTINIGSVFSTIYGADITYEIVQFDIQHAVTESYSIGRNGTILEQWLMRYQTWRKPKTAILPYSLEKERLKSILKENFEAFEDPPVDAKFEVLRGGRINILPESTGIVFDYELAINEFQKDIANISLKKIEMTQIAAEPSVRKKNIEELSDDFKQFTSTRPYINLSLNNEYSHAIPSSAYQEWFTSKQNKESTVGLYFDIEKVKAYLEKNVAEDIKIPVQEARFVLKEDNVVEEFTPSSNGRSLDAELTAIKLIDNIFEKEIFVAELAIKIEKPQFTTETINNKGIKESLGVGHSNFAGSPQNRRHNIKTGANSLHGLLIAPGEEFSIIKALGEIEAATGYLPELVIKGNRTIPEYGGGLCQIGTTLFRAIMESGLPVTERQNHSYQVSYYYENGVSGTDATIYGPHPDLRFINDTGNYILIQRRIDGDDIYFEFWGTSDGRKKERTIPEVYNITAPPPAKYIKSADLEPGKEKCIERAHAGADAEFTYTVTYPDGQVKETVFKSHYRPWQAVCLIGANAEDLVENGE